MLASFSNLRPSLLLLLGVVLVGRAAAYPFFHDLDLSIANTLALEIETGRDRLIAFFQSVSWVGGGWRRYVLAALLAALLWRWRGLKSALLMVAAVVLAGFASDGIKLLFGRTRPDLVPHLDHAPGFAFTSGHSTSAMVIPLAFVLLMGKGRDPRWLGAALLFALLGGWSRLALAVHWPSDVLGGWLLGAAFAYAALGFAARAERQSV